MTLRPCYRATCDAPGCAAAEMLAHARAGHARAELEALGWTVIPRREPPQSGAPRILYACPAAPQLGPGGDAGCWSLQQ
jgi:hypothetical protein